MQPIVELERVHREYGEGSGAVHAVIDVSLVVDEGEFVSLVGASGSGKSTLLHLIAGLDDPTRGRVRVLGRDLQTLAERERSALRLRTLGIVFQAYHLLPRLTVERNVAWRLARLGQGRKQVWERARQALEQAEVPASAWRRYPAELSGGEQQRVAVARALATEPRLLLADEPTGNLDSRSGRAILDLLRQVSRAHGMAVVLVTHDAEAASFGDRVVRMSDGRVVPDKTPLRRLFRSVRLEQVAS